MAGEGTKVGEVYVEIKATGAENVAKEVQKAQTMATAPSGFMQIPSWAGSAGANSTMTMGGGGSPAEQIRAVEQAATAAAPALENAGQKVVSLKDRLKASVQGLTEARQGINAIAGATLGWISTLSLVALPITMVVNYLHEKRKAALDASRALGDLTEGWQEYMKSITDPTMDEAERKIGEINKRLEDQVKQIDELGSKAGRSSSEIGADVASARADAQVARDKVRADAAEKQRQDEAKKEKAAYEKILQETRTLEMQAEDERLSDVDRVNAERFRKMGDLEDRLSRAEDEETQAAIQRQIDAINQIYDYKVQKVQAAEATSLEAERKANEQRLEAAREQAQQVAQLYVNAANQSRSAIQAAFGGGTSSLLSEMVAKLNIIANSIQRGGG